MSRKSRTSDVGQAISEAIDVMKREMTENDGIYPRNGGRVSLAEVCRRAGVAPVSVMGRNHRETTRLTIHDWIATLPSSRSSRRVRSKLRNASKVSTADLLVALATKYQELYQVEIPRWNAERQSLLAQIDALESENARLRVDASHGRVVLMRSKGE